MAPALPPALLVLAERQAGVVTRTQVLGSGLGDGSIESALSAGRWQRVHRGVYCTFTGPLPRLSVLWAAVLVSGRGAVLARETALEADGVLDLADLVHVMVTPDRRVDAPDGVRVQSSSRLALSRHPAALPPRTKVEESVLDTVAASGRELDVVDVLLRACQRRRTTPARLLDATERRKKLPWRALVRDVLADAADGTESPLERRYLRDVERRHGLPRARRQAGARLALGTVWRDVRYDAFGLIVELDGRATRPAEAAFRDYRRDNEATRRLEHSLRYGWHDVAGLPCAVAAQVAEVLLALGWRRRPVACGGACPVGGLLRPALSP